MIPAMLFLMFGGRRPRASPIEYAFLATLTAMAREIFRMAFRGG